MVVPSDAAQILASFYATGGCCARPSWYQTAFRPKVAPQFGTPLRRRSTPATRMRTVPERSKPRGHCKTS